MDVLEDRLGRIVSCKTDLVIFDYKAPAWQIPMLLLSGDLFDFLNSPALSFVKRPLNLLFPEEPLFGGLAARPKGIVSLLFDDSPFGPRIVIINDPVFELRFADRSGCIPYLVQKLLIRVPQSL